MNKESGVKKNLLRISVVFIVLVSCALFLVSAKAQTEQERIAELRKQIEELEAQAAQFRSGIASERAKAESLQRDITILKQEIVSLENQIYLTGKKIDKTGLEIGQISDSIADTEYEMDRRRESIGRLVLFLEQRDNENLLALLMKNETLSDFFRQAHYAATINEQLNEIINALKNLKHTLESDKFSLEEKKTELERLSREQQAKKNSLGDAKSQKDTLLKVTKGQETQYKKLLADTETRKNLFFQELRQLETKVITGGLYEVRVTATSVPKKGTKLFGPPEDGYRLTQGYGMTRYARRGVYGGAPHNGIDLAGGYGSEIMAIGEGEIIANGTNDGFGNWVAIKHLNNMVSVYAHMSAFAFLPVGTKVKAGQVIGYEGSTGNSTGSHLHLSLYRDFFTYVNSSKKQLYFNYFEGSLNPLDYM